MSPPRRGPNRQSAARRRRGLWLSLIIVVVVAFGSLLGVLLAGWSPRLGLDLAGGLSVTYQAPKNVSTSDLNQTVDILNNRVDQVGVSGAQVSTQGKNQIVVSIPGISNGRAVLAEISKPAQLLFRPGLCYAPKYDGSKAHLASANHPSQLPACSSAYTITASNAQDVGDDPSFAAYPSTKNDVKDSEVLLPGAPGTDAAGFRFVLAKAPLTGKIVKNAVAQQLTSGEWVVNYNLTSTGSPEWNDLASANYHKIVAIELDGEVYSAPRIDAKNFDGSGEISGGLTETTAKNLAQAINFGALPVPLKTIQVQTVSPTLGKSSLEAGLGAGIVGLILVLLYTIIYYRFLGIVAVTGLAVTASLLYAIISALGHTSAAPSFDLAGVTGIIVSIGITVDSYIVYFERLKDETRAGRTVRTSVERGFKNAFRTVLAADLVSLIGAVLLYFLATSDVRGFAFFLGLSTLLDIIITYFFTRPLVAILGTNETVTEAKHIGISRGLAVHAGAGAEQ